ncbi:hypothetical protein MJH12_20035, partial [bacterium]|nr:hypothetical protein [bacterium]
TIDSSLGAGLGALGNAIRLNSGEVYLVLAGNGTVKKIIPPLYDTVSDLGTAACTNSIDAMYFFNDKTGYAVCSNASFDVMYTSDSGQSWAKTDSGPGKVKDIHFFNQTEGVLVLDSNPNEIYYTVSSGRDWTLSHNGSARLLPWVIYEDTIYTTNLAANEFLISTNHGQSFTAYTDAFFANTFHSLTYNASNDTLYAIVFTTEYQLHKSTDNGATWTQVSLGGLEIAFRASIPQGLIALGNYIYIATNDGSTSMLRYNISESNLLQFTSNFQAVTESAVSNTSDLNPLYISKGRFLLSQAGGSLAIFETKIFKHIRDNSLTSNSLQNSLLTTHHFILSSISGDKIASDVLSASHIQNNAFTHGEYVVYDKLVRPFSRLFPINGGSKVLALFDSSP